MYSDEIIEQYRNDAQGLASYFWDDYFSRHEKKFPILVDCKPQFFPSDMIKILKGNTARWLFMKHPELKKQLWGGHLWNPSYCIVTASDRSYDQVKQYIDSQKTR
jgi:hypothetical protein